MHMVQLMPLPPLHFLLHKNPEWLYLFGGGLPRMSWYLSVCLLTDRRQKVTNGEACIDCYFCILTAISCCVVCINQWALLLRLFGLFSWLSFLQSLQSGLLSQKRASDTNRIRFSEAERQVMSSKQQCQHTEGW